MRAAELLLATSPSGIAVLHVYDDRGKRLETCTGTAAELRTHAAKHHPGIPVKQISA